VRPPRKESAKPRRRVRGGTGLPALCIALCTALAASLWAATGGDDVILRAMRDELARARTIHLANLEPPYFISYSLDDVDSYAVTATLGGIVSSRHDRFRFPDVEVRVGDYKFDNTNFAAGGFFSASRYDLRFPLENDYGALRRYFWLSTDSAYKGAVQAYSRKRAALKNVAVSDQLDDFAHAQPVERLLPPQRQKFEDEPRQALARSLSAIFTGFPLIRESSVEDVVSQSIHYQVNTEGTELRYPDRLEYVRVRARAQAPDGMLLHDAIVFHTHDLGHLPAEAEMRRGVTALAGNLSKLAEAPMGETYNGPVLFEGEAAAQLFAELLGRNLAPTRRPVGEGRGAFVTPSELEGRQGSRILPEFFTVVDDPTQTEYRGRPLFGHYEVDREGVVPQPLLLVEKGVLKNFLLTRQPVRGYEGSNGRALLPGPYGASTAGFGNLFVKAAETVPPAQLKKKLIEMCQNRGKPYGVVVRKLDYPSSASFQELRQMFGRGAQGAGQRGVPPVLVYRIYPDGREELIRGVRLGGLNTRSLKDIMAAGDDETIFDFLDNAAPLALMGAGGFVTEAAVIAPSVLIDDLELHKIDEELPKLPIVPAP
jgi:predicted Zn-dependent protease